MRYCYIPTVREGHDSVISHSDPGYNTCTKPGWSACMHVHTRTRTNEPPVTLHIGEHGEELIRLHPVSPLCSCDSAEGEQRVEPTGQKGRAGGAGATSDPAVRRWRRKGSRFPVLASGAQQRCGGPSPTRHSMVWHAEPLSPLTVSS